MQGISGKIEGSNLVITVPLNTPPVASKSGKSLTIATTQGNHPVPGLVFNGKSVTVGLTAYIKP